jgi:hypothetical protein
VIDSYLGYSLGNYSINFSPAGNAKIAYHKYYFQIGIHKIINRLSLSITCRFGHLNIKKIELFGRMPIIEFNHFKTMSNEMKFRIQEFSFRVSYRVRTITRLFQL